MWYVIITKCCIVILFLTVISIFSYHGVLLTALKLIRLNFSRHIRQGNYTIYKVMEIAGCWLRKNDLQSNYTPYQLHGHHISQSVRKYFRNPGSKLLMISHARTLYLCPLLQPDETHFNSLKQVFFKLLFNATSLLAVINTFFYNYFSSYSLLVVLKLWFPDQQHQLHGHTQELVRNANYLVLLEVEPRNLHFKPFE